MRVLWQLLPQAERHRSGFGRSSLARSTLRSPPASCLCSPHAHVRLDERCLESSGARVSVCGLPKRQPAWFRRGRGRRAAAGSAGRAAERGGARDSSAANFCSTQRSRGCRHKLHVSLSANVCPPAFVRPPNTTIASFSPNAVDGRRRRHVASVSQRAPLLARGPLDTVPSGKYSATWPERREMASPPTRALSHSCNVNANACECEHTVRAQAELDRVQRRQRGRGLPWASGRCAGCTRRCSTSSCSTVAPPALVWTARIRR
jgi:hypothetical protein